MSDTPNKPQPLSLTVGDLANMEGALITLSNTSGLPTKTSYRIARLISKLKPDYQEFGTKRQELLDRYGSPATVTDTEGNAVPNGAYNIRPENIGDFNREYAELLAEPVVLAGWLPLSLDDFGKAEIVPVHLVSLAPLLAPEDDLERVANSKPDTADAPVADA